MYSFVKKDYTFYIRPEKNESTNSTKFRIAGYLQSDANTTV